MRRLIARRLLDRFEHRYGYDASYMRMMLEVAPSAFFKFGKILPVAQYHRAAPAEACFAVKLTGALAEDCGPCTQLVVEMAREAGVDPGQVRAVLTRNESRMTQDTRTGFRFADAVATESASAGKARAAVRDQWGDAGIVELSLALALGRVFPMTKAAMGFAKTCRRVDVAGHSVEVLKPAIRVRG